MSEPALGALPDLRVRVTGRTATFLGEGRACVVVGGPATGKTRLLQEIARRVPGVVAMDDATCAELGDALASDRRPLIVSVGALSYEEARGLAKGEAFVPLVNVPQPWIRDAASDDGDERWRVSLGHPGLASAAGEPAALESLRVRLRGEWVRLLEERFEEELVVTELRKMATGSPTQRYARLLATHGEALKHHLDWLACAGIVTRLIDGEAAGVSAVPLTDQGR